MKRVVIFLLGILAVASCQKYTIGQIVGVWEVISFENYSYADNLSTHGSPGFKTIEFKRKGVGYAGDSPFHYVLDGDKLIIKFTDGAVWKCTIDYMSFGKMQFFCDYSPGKWIYKYTFTLKKIE